MMAKKVGETLSFLDIIGLIFIVGFKVLATL